MSGSFYFEGSGYFSNSFIINSTMSNNILTKSSINTSSLDMLNTAGNYQNITSVKDPINPQDAATKHYVDALNIVISNISLTSTQGSSISSDLMGTFVITVKNLVLNGPSASFHITKNTPSVCAHIVRQTSCPGFNTNNCLLDMSWPMNSTPLLNKTSIDYDGSYEVKII